MFIINRNSESSERAVTEFLASIDSPWNRQGDFVNLRILDDYNLVWVKVRPLDNLHIFVDGFVVGKLNFLENDSLSPIRHNTSVHNESLHPLLHSTVVSESNGQLFIRPNEHVNIYYSDTCISDFQLLIAKAEELKPDPGASVLLGTIGYFPGNVTLFKEIQKIPYLETLRFPALVSQRHAHFRARPSDDHKMVGRFLDIIPRDSKPAIALSGGLDSRFVLGLLLRKNLAPKAYTLAGAETAIVEKICSRARLHLTVADHKPINELAYTLMSDARIYYRGGNFSQMINAVNNEVLHNGLWSDPAIENAFKTAWKRPGSRKNIYADLIWYALLSTTPQVVKGYLHSPRKVVLFETLQAQLASGKDYFDFRSRKQWAAWFYHIHRGLNWTNAAMADTSFLTYPVYVLGERTGMEYGLTSSAYLNFYKERLRRINRELLPQFDIDYSGGRSWKSLPPLICDIHKLYYEYPKRFLSRRKAIKGAIAGPGQSLFHGISMKMAEGFENIFSAPYKELLYDQSVSHKVKRAAVTINNTLKYLSKEHDS